MKKSTNRNIHNKNKSGQSKINFHDSFKGRYNIFFWVASIILSIIAFFTTIPNTIVLIIVALFINPYIRINYIEKVIKPFPYFLPPVALAVVFLLLGIVSSENNIYAENSQNPSDEKLNMVIEKTESIDESMEEDDLSDELPPKDTNKKIKTILSEEDYKEACEKVDYFEAQKMDLGSKICIEVVNCGTNLFCDANMVVPAAGYQRIQHTYIIDSDNEVLNSTTSETEPVFKVFGEINSRGDIIGRTGYPDIYIDAIYVEYMCDILDYNPPEIPSYIDLSKEEFINQSEHITNSAKLSSDIQTIVDFDYYITKISKYKKEDAGSILAKEDGSDYTYSRYLFRGYVKGKFQGKSIDSYISLNIAKEGNINPANYVVGQKIHVYAAYQGKRLVAVYIQ